MNETEWHLPWRVDLSSWDVVDNNGDEVVHVASRYPDVEAAEVLRLMAAAPETADKLRELTEAVEALATYVDAYEWGRKWAGRPHAQMDAVRAALARARGA